MDCLIVASTEPYAGKTGVVASLLLEAAARGLVAGYFKPFGTMPVTIDGAVTDRDAAYLASLAGVHPPADAVCPVVRTRALIERALAGEDTDLLSRVSEAYKTVSAGTDVVFVEGPSGLSQGRAFGLDLKHLADLFCGRVLLVSRPGVGAIPEDVLQAHDVLGESLYGVLFNNVSEGRLAAVHDKLVPYLRGQHVSVTGILQHDSALSSVTVAEIVTELEGTVLSAENAVDRAVESFMVGAMGQEKALRYFRRKARKAVVTGGDRSDVQLAALETDTRMVICTGGMMPSSLVLARAEEIGVPVVLVDMDTLSAVERMEGLFGRVRVHDAEKVAKIRKMLAESADLEGIFAALPTHRER